MSKVNIDKSLPILIISAVVAKIIVSFFVQLGNEEAYYWIYALYPDWSHYEHPPMVGWMVQFFSVNLVLDHQVFLRLGSIIIAAANTYMIFRLGTLLKDELTGWYAAIMFSSSIYLGIIGGFMIMPDAPLLFFWILAIFCLVKSLPMDPQEAKSKENMLFFGIAAGLAMMSKYSGSFLWLGALVYIVFFNRAWFSSWTLYVSAFITLFLFSPVTLWNMENDYISFTFHQSRLSGVSGIDFIGFLKEVSGGFIYQNPVIFVLAALALIAAFQGKNFIDRERKKILFLVSLPLLLAVWCVSLVSNTLPHWSGPSFVGLVLLAAAWLSDKFGEREVAWPKSMMAAKGLFYVTLVLGAVVLSTGTGLRGPASDAPDNQLGSGDISLDMQGWGQVEEGFSAILERDLSEGKINEGPALISYEWSPAAHIDYYVARPNGLDLYAIGPVGDIRKYHWTNPLKAGLSKGRDAYCIAPSNRFKDPATLYGDLFDNIELAGTVKISRGGIHVRNALVYRMRGYRGE